MNTQSIRIELIGELVDLVKNCHQYSKTSQTDKLILRVLAVPQTSCDQMLASISDIQAENRRIVPYVHTVPGSYYANNYLGLEEEDADENVKTLKTSIFQGLREIAANIYDPRREIECDEEIIEFIHKGITEVGLDSSSATLYPIMKEMNSYIDLSRECKFLDYEVHHNA